MAQGEDVEPRLTTARRIREDHSLSDDDQARILGESALREQYWMGLSGKLGAELDRMEATARRLQDQNRRLREQLAEATRPALHTLEPAADEEPAAATG